MNWKGPLAGAIVVAGALGAFLYVTRPPEIPEEVVEESAPQKSAPKDATKVQKPVTPAPEKPLTPAEKARRERAQKLRKMSPEERIDFLFDEAAKKPIDLTAPTNRIFATGTEQVMSWIFTRRLGDIPPPLPAISIRDEAHLAEIIMNQNVVREGDSEQVAEAKEMVQLAKEELKKYIKEGGNIQDFLEYYRGKLVEAHEEWSASQRSVMKVLREEPEIALDYLDEVNARLEEKGIKPVTIPKRLLQRMGLE